MIGSIVYLSLLLNVVLIIKLISKQGNKQLNNYLVYLRDYEKFDVVEIIAQQQQCYDTYKILDILKSGLLNTISPFCLQARPLICPRSFTSILS